MASLEGEPNQGHKTTALDNTLDSMHDAGIGVDVVIRLFSLRRRVVSSAEDGLDIDYKRQEFLKYLVGTGRLS